MGASLEAELTIASIYCNSWVGYRCKSPTVSPMQLTRLFDEQESDMTNNVRDNLLLLRSMVPVLKKLCSVVSLNRYTMI